MWADDSTRRRAKQRWRRRRGRKDDGRGERRRDRPQPDAGKPRMLREIFYRQFADIRPHEWPRALSLSLFFFLIIATYWILKPVKRALIINHFQEDPLELLGIRLEEHTSELQSRENLICRLLL